MNGSEPEPDPADTVVDVTASGETVALVVVDASTDVVVVEPSECTVVVVCGAVVVVVPPTVVVVGATVVVVVTGAAVVVVVGATVVVVVTGAAVVVVVGATVVVVVTGATVVVVVTGATVVVVVTGATVVVVVPGGTVVVVVTGGTVVVVVTGATVVVVVGATVVVVVVGAIVVVVVVTAGTSGSWMFKNVWSPVAALLFDDTLILQFLKSARSSLAVIGGSLGARQLNNDDGLWPLNGTNAWFGSVAEKVATPLAFAIAGAVVCEMSQLPTADHPGVVGAIPSHWSTNTCWPGVKPVATIVNATGFPAPSSGTMNGLPVGVEIAVTAKATPAPAKRTAAAIAATAPTRRPRPSIAARPSIEFGSSMSLCHSRAPGHR